MQLVHQGFQKSNVVLFLPVVVFPLVVNLLMVVEVVEFREAGAFTGRHCHHCPNHVKPQVTSFVYLFPFLVCHLQDNHYNFLNQVIWAVA